MSKYTLAQILDAWTAAYGEDMQEEYPGFIQRLSEEKKNENNKTKRLNTLFHDDARTAAGVISCQL